MSVITPLTNENATNRDHIEMAPLIDFEREAPLVTNPSKHNCDVIDLTSPQSSSSGHTLVNGGTTPLDIPNDQGLRGKPGGIRRGGEGGGGEEGPGEEDGDVKDDTATESILGSQQELF